MAEDAFNDPQMMNNGFQDPMGNDAHQGLERFLDKFHQPAVPAYTLITDPEYYVFLWFHDAIGNLIDCPYLEDYRPKLSQSSVEFEHANYNFKSKTGIQSGMKEPTLPDYCVDLTPFVREATLPEIAPAGGDKIRTLFGETSAGSFSPYASDGSKTITLQMLDTEYSILDAIFYPWMKDINSPWWYRPDKAYDEWATPFPMATLEVQRPRMRYLPDQDPAESRNDVTWYTYYSYKFIGVKPTSYASFDVNGAGRNTLQRSLSLICDMCLVDLTGDVAGSGKGSMNLGNRSTFIFKDASSSGSSNEDDKADDRTQDVEEMQRRAEEANQEAAAMEQEAMENAQAAEQQNQGDMPGDDEPEVRDPEDPEYNQDENADNHGEDSEQERNMDYDGGEPPDPGDVSSDPESTDNTEPWQDPESKMYEDLELGNSNGDANNYEMNNDKTQPTTQEESSFFDSVMDGLKDVGSGIADAAKTAGGWVADGADAAMGLASDVAGAAVGTAVDVASAAVSTAGGLAGTALNAAGGLAGSALNVAGGLAGSALGAAGGLAQTALGAASGLASTAIGAASSIGGAAVGTATNLAGTALFGAGTIAGSALGTVGKAASGLLGGLLGGSSSSSQQSSSGGLFSVLDSALNAASNIGQTAFGVVSNVSSSAAEGLGATAKSAVSGVGKIASSAITGASSIGSSVVKGLVGAPSSTTTLLGGVLNKASTAAFAAVGDMVGQAGNVIGGTAKAVTKGTAAVAGSILQGTDATKQVRNAGLMVSALNDASQGIQSGINLVGDVATSVTKVSTGAAGAVVNELGSLVNRMTQSPGNKPTPVESYVAMVTKNDTKNMTMA